MSLSRTNKLSQVVVTSGLAPQFYADLSIALMISLISDAQIWYTTS